MMADHNHHDHDHNHLEINSSKDMSENNHQHLNDLNEPKDHHHKHHKDKDHANKKAFDISVVCDQFEKCISDKNNIDMNHYLCAYNELLR